MNATLLEIPVQAVCPSRREVELTALVEKLLGEVSQLRIEVAELRQQAGYWKEMFEQAKWKNEKLEKEIDSLRAENRQLKDRLFAAKSEKKPSKDRSNGLDDPKAVNTPRRPRGHQPDAPGPQRRDHSHLPVVKEEVELPSDETTCPKCGKLAAEMSETEDSDAIEVEVRAYRRRIHRKRYRRTCDCPNESQTLTAPAPPKLIPKGRYGVSVWVHLPLGEVCFASGVGQCDRGVIALRPRLAARHDHRRPETCLATAGADLRGDSGPQRRVFLSPGGRDPLVGIRRAGRQNRLPLVALGVLERRHNRHSDRAHAIA